MFKRRPTQVIALDIDGVLIPTSAREGREVYSVFNSGLVPLSVINAVRELIAGKPEIMWFTSWDEETACETFEWLGLGELSAISLAGDPMGTKVEQKVAGMEKFLIDNPRAHVTIVDDEVVLNSTRVNTVSVDSRTGLNVESALFALIINDQLRSGQ